ncbi:MAG: HNH endonuclease signature motif containing protein [Candidatus Zixiibacteriota bacterium]
MARHKDKGCSENAIFNQRTMKDDNKTVIEDFVDYLMPELTPYETSLYLYLLRNSFFKHGLDEVRVGKRTISKKYGKGSRGEKTNYQHISAVLKKLEAKGCVKVKDTNRSGTMYIVSLPKDVPVVAEKIANALPYEGEEDYFSNPEKRQEIFERDMWICRYCGEKVIPESATLDHFVPQSKGGKSNKDNLRTCCWICNSIKSGKSYDEAALSLLQSIQERKARSHK